MLKIEISLDNYNKLRAKEEILTQLSSLATPTTEFQSVFNAYKKIQTILESIDNMIPTEFSELKNVKIKLNRKVYEYYLNIQMIFGQIEYINTNNQSYDSLVQYWNNFIIYKTSFRELIKKKSADIEEFNTLIKIEKENRILKKKNVDLETLLNNKSDKDFYGEEDDFSI